MSASVSQASRGVMRGNGGGIGNEDGEEDGGGVGGGVSGGTNDGDCSTAGMCFEVGGVLPCKIVWCRW